MSWILCSENEMPLCVACNKRITQGFGHCSGCFSNTCATCDFNYYECYGNHDFPSRACDYCFPKFGQLIRDKYYCPRCAPSSSYDEAKFKNDIYFFQEECIRYFFNKGKTWFSSYPITDEELNDPKNWRKHKQNPFYIKKKIRNFFKNQYKPKKIWRVKEK